MSFPKSSSPVPVIAWLAEEPFRIFFLMGALWSIAGVSLWPLYYAGVWPYYPGITHARIMIEAFGGAFVVGFLGTAGPRLAEAPRLSAGELLSLVALHLATGICHWQLQIRMGDLCFMALLGVLLLSLLVRVLRSGRHMMPPEFVLACAGLLSGISGAFMLQQPVLMTSLETFRLAGLLLYQGFLLPPILGIGAWFFPRLLGGEFSDATTAAQRRRKLLWAVLTAALILLSFVIETAGSPGFGYLVRTGTAVVYLCTAVRWQRPQGTLPAGLYWAMGAGLLGLGTAGLGYVHHVAWEHLLYIGCFGLLMLIVASRVLCGHSGELTAFTKRSGVARSMIGLAVIAASTRASADFWPKITISHHKYAAWSWGLCVLMWLWYHRRRFGKRED